MKDSTFSRTLVFTAIFAAQSCALCFDSRAAAGDVDLSFDTGSGINGAVTTLAVQTDGKVLVAGQFTTVKGLARQSIARLTVNGDGDPTFNAGTVADRYVTAVALQSDGKAVFIRDFYNLTGAAPGYKVARLNTDGTLDGNFSPNIGTNIYGSGFTCLVVQPDGKIVLGGYYNDYVVDDQGSGYYDKRPLLVRLNADGNSDNGFTTNNGVYGSSFSAMALQSDGKLVIAGNIVTTINGTNRFAIARLNPNGTLDSGFNPGVDGFVQAIGIQGDGKILVGGSGIGNSTNRNAIARLNLDGTHDSTFQSGTDTNSSLVSLAIQSDGKVVCSGGYIYVNGVSRDGLIRLNSDGSADPAFNAGTGAPNNSGAAIALQSDGKIILGGAFTLINGTNRERAARLNSDGSVDNSFVPGSSINGVVNQVALQPDHKVVVGGEFTIAGGALRNRVARLKSDGHLDSSFNSGAGVYGEYFKLQIASVVAQPDGKTIIGGDFTSINGTNCNRIARLNADGTLDSSFVSGMGLSSLHVATLVLQPDGKLLVGGDPSLGGSGNVSGMLRLNTNGSLDAGFQAPGQRAISRESMLWSCSRTRKLLPAAT
jgi:uncharacterized delta-60 repeat protein